MAKYPNQNTIILNYAPADERNYYAKINSSALTRATKVLTHKALLKNIARITLNGLRIFLFRPQIISVSVL